MNTLANTQAIFSVMGIIGFLLVCLALGILLFVVFPPSSAVRRGYRLRLASVSLQSARRCVRKARKDVGDLDPSILLDLEEIEESINTAIYKLEPEAHEPPPGQH